MNVCIVNNFKSKISICDLNKYKSFYIKIYKATPIFLKTYNSTHGKKTKRETNFVQREQVFEKKFNKISTFFKFMEKVNFGFYLKVISSEKTIFDGSVFSFKRQCEIKSNSEI